MNHTNNDRVPVPMARQIARKIEYGTLFPPPIATTLGHLYQKLTARFLPRPITLPEHTAVIGIGGALFGGSGKTPVAIAYAQSLKQSGARVSFVAHGYRSRQTTPLRCTGRESHQQVGDDTLVAVLALRNDLIPVWVGNNRSQTLQAAAAHADVVVIDGLLQTRPKRLARSVLVLDAMNPFGSGICFPGGDLRGPVDRLMDLCDEVVLVEDSIFEASERISLGKPVGIPIGKERRRAVLDIRGAWCRGVTVPLRHLAEQRTGLITLVARPDRIVASLRARGIRPMAHWQGSDHGTPSSSDLEGLRKLVKYYRLDTWIVTTKCVTHFGQVPGAPLSILDVTTRLDPTPLPVLDSPPCVPQRSSSSY